MYIYAFLYVYTYSIHTVFSIHSTDNISLKHARIHDIILKLSKVIGVPQNHPVTHFEYWNRWLEGVPPLTLETSVLVASISPSLSQKSWPTTKRSLQIKLPIQLVERIIFYIQYLIIFHSHSCVVQNLKGLYQIYIYI